MELVIENDLLDKINNLTIKHYPNEFGGFLIGQYLNNFKTIKISSFILPEKYKSSRTSFSRSTECLKNKFEKIFMDSKQYYVGEWHSHPNGTAMYSETDLNAMKNIVDCDTVMITNPILLILSINKGHKIKPVFYFYDNQKLIPYE